MAPSPTERFATALNELEAGGDLDAFLPVFADDAELSRPEKDQRVDAPTGARTFWQDYLAVFEQVRSEFVRTVDGEVGVLEWISTGQLRTGGPIRYRGVSLLDFDEAGRVTRFATYYDTAPFTPRG